MSKDKFLNKKYNELKILEHTSKPENEHKYQSWHTDKWVKCQCSCGKIITVPLYGVTHGLIKSCGCLKAKIAANTLKMIREKHPTPTAIFLTHNGETLNISQWAKKTGIPRSTIIYRMNKNLPIDKILEKRSDVYE